MSSQDVATAEVITPPSPALGGPPPGADRPRRPARPRPAGPGVALIALVGGVVAALAAQGLVVAGARGSTVLLAFAVAAASFLIGLVLDSGSGLLTWRGPLAERTPAVARP